MRLALRLHRTLGELGEEMTAEEFALWQVFLEEEPLEPGITAALGELLFAIYQALLPKKRGSWSLSDFVPKRWRKPDPDAGAPPSADALRAFLKR
jgi:hypothetical protein